MKFKERFEKNRDKLFTFLSYDGVPWNNNNAEHAVKPFADASGSHRGSHRRKGLRDYLVLLSLCETCKYMGVDFLDFLRSGEKDIHAFAESRRGAGAGHLPANRKRRQRMRRRGNELPCAGWPSSCSSRPVLRSRTAAGGGDEALIGWLMVES